MRDSEERTGGTGLADRRKKGGDLFDTAQIT